eukprot:g617.t1
MAEVRQAPDTDWFYTTKEVCASTDPKDASVSAEKYQTYSTAAAAHAAGKKIAHCGACGACSNVQDLIIYGETRNTLTEVSKACAVKYFIPFGGGRSLLNKCVDEDIGFTPACRDVWVDNMINTAHECIFTCTKSIILMEENNKEQSSTGELNDCLECDEKLSGPAFTTGAGANRRRAGIYSAIGRDDKNQHCTTIDVTW